MAVLSVFRWAALIALIGLVGCTGQSNAPIVVRFDSSDETKASSAKGGAAPNATAVPAPSKVSPKAPANNAPKIVSNLTPARTVTPIEGSTPFAAVDSTSIEVAMSDGPGLLDKPAPDVEIAELGHGRFQLKNHRGLNIVVLDFWATWCVPCVQELPALTRALRAYEDKGVVFRAVNVDEDRLDVADFVKARRLDAPIALDEDATVADAYGAQTLPVLVIIDKAGIVRSIHVAAIENPASVLSKELDAILENRPLPQRSTASLASRSDSSHEHGLHGHDHSHDSLSEGIVIGEENPIHVQSHGKGDWRLALDSGRVIDVGKVFAEERAGLEERLQASYDSKEFLRVNHESTSKPFLLVSRRRGALSGPMASFYPDGSPTAYMEYKAGKRTSALLSWDSAKRPLIFEQCQDGQKHGLRCVFKACSDNCPEAHIWMVQEWSRGTIQQAHVVPADGKPVTFEYANGKPITRNDVSTEDLEAALAKLDEFDDKVAANEKELKAAVGQLNRQERRAISEMKRTAAAQRRNQMMASMGSSMRGSYRRPSMVSTRACTTGG